MKVIKDYLSNQKDIYTMNWLNEMKKDETNLVLVKYWLDKVVFISDELNTINKAHGKG